jgi:hypothetical protein
MNNKKATNKTAATPKKIEAKTQFGRDLADLLFVWQTVEMAARRHLPHATDEEIYEAVSGAAKYGMGL